MCRPFGLSATPRRVTATFWVIDAPESLAIQSCREPDGVVAYQRLTSQLAVGRPPAHQLTLADLHPRAAASQRSDAGPPGLSSWLGSGAETVCAVRRCWFGRR